MSSSFLVFAGLGSLSIFSQEAFRQANRDASNPECTVLLQSCYMLFRQQISESVHRNIISQGTIDLEDFTEPLSLTQPAVKYRQNAIIQHTTLYLHQIMRYLVCRHDLGSLVGSVGICAGLLPAAVASAGSLSTAEIISLACNFFQVALCIGIRCEAHCRRRLTTGTPDSNNVPQPCSYVVDGVSRESVTELLTRANVVCRQQHDVKAGLAKVTHNYLLTGQRCLCVRSALTDTSHTERHPVETCLLYRGYSAR